MPPPPPTKRLRVNDEVDARSQGWLLGGHAFCATTHGSTLRGAPPFYQLCFWHIEILNAFLFEYVFCKLSQMEKKSMCVSRRDRHMHVHHALPPCLETACGCPKSTRFWGLTMHGRKFSKNQSKYKAHVLHLWLSKQGHWQLLEVTLPIGTRLALKKDNPI